MDKISIILSTRQRVDLLKTLIQSLHDTTSDMDCIELCIGVDDDDIETIKFVKSISNIDCHYIIFPRNGNINLSANANALYKQSTGHILFGTADDFIFRTQGWDTIIRQTFDKVMDHILFIGVNYGHNSNANKSDVGFIHRQWTDVVGYFQPSQLRFSFGDTWILEVAKKIQRHVYLPQVVIEHVDYKYGHAREPDNTNLAMDLNRFNAHEETVWNNTKELRDADAKKLLDFINTYQSHLDIYTKL